jgi:hypothetical protein
MQEQELDKSRVEYFDRQQTLYVRGASLEENRAKADIVQKYLGEFIAFEDGEVLDHDHNEPALLARVYAKQGYRDLLIKKVWDLDPELSVSSTSYSAGVGNSSECGKLH